MIWHRQVYFSESASVFQSRNVYVLRHIACMNHWLSKLASTFVLALIEEKSTPLNFLYFSTQLSLKILAKQSKTAKDMLACISLLNFSTWRKQGTSPDHLLCFSDVMFTCQGRFGKFMPASKLPSTFVLAFIEGIFMPLNRR